MREAWSVWAELSRSLSGPWGAVSCVTGRVHCVVDSQRVLMSVVFSFPTVLGPELALQNAPGTSPPALLLQGHSSTSWDSACQGMGLWHF